MKSVAEAERRWIEQWRIASQLLDQLDSRLVTEGANLRVAAPALTQSVGELLASA